VHDRIKERLENSSNAYATLIFFYDTAATNDDAELFKIPKDELEEWSLQSSVMLMNFL
jgi:predicted oxidoreductase (fatty acid repression mutant protein)